MPDVISSPSTETREIAAGFAAGQAILKPRKARPFYGRHPWVLDSAIARVEGSPTDGDVVDLLTDTGKFVARGLFNSQSRIRVRLYTWDNTQALDGELFRAATAQRPSLARPSWGSTRPTAQPDWCSAKPTG